MVVEGSKQCERVDAVVHDRLNVAEPRQSKIGMDRLVQLDALRGFAALMVMGYHYTAKFGEAYGHPTALPFEVTFGFYGVRLFFMVSGFVIFMTLERVSDYKDFIVSRFARLYPAYWASVLLTYLVISICSLPGREVGRRVVLINMTMFQHWFNVDHVDGVYWTLSIEMSFYAIMLVIFLLRSLNKIQGIAVIWLCVMVLTRILDNSGVLKIPGLLQELFLLEYGNLFFAGIMFFKLRKNGIKAFTNLIILAALVVECYIRGFESALITSVFFALFYCIIFEVPFVNLLLKTKVFVFLGTISYSLYLLHQNIGYVLLLKLYALGLNPIAATLTVSTAMFVLAACMTAYVETPLRETIRRWHGCRKEKRLQLAASRNSMDLT